MKSSLVFGLASKIDLMLTCASARGGNYQTCVESDNPDSNKEGECGVPGESVPNRSAAFFISLSSSLCLSLRAFAFGSKTASSSYNSSSSGDLAARAASFSASFAFRVPFFFGGAALDPGTGGFSCSDSEFSQSLWCRCERLVGVACGGLGILEDLRQDHRLHHPHLAICSLS